MNGPKKKGGSRKVEAGSKKKGGRRKAEGGSTDFFLPPSTSHLPPSLQSLYESCNLCPRACGVNRMKGESGFCREAETLRVAYVGPHFGEEPPLTGTCGSGT